MRILQADARKIRHADLVSMHSAHSVAAVPKPRGFHVVLSDMCHNTVGNSAADVLRSLELAQSAAAIAVGDEDEGDEEVAPKELHNASTGGRLHSL